MAFCGEVMRGIDPEELRKMYTSGVLLDDIAAHFGCGATTVVNRVKRLGIKRRRRVAGKIWDAEDIRQLRELKKLGLKPSEIAKVMDRTPASIGGACVRFAIHDAPAPKPRDRTPPFVRREVTFYPPAWTKRRDRKLFEACMRAFEDTGSIYGEICLFATKYGLTIDAVLGRWHRIARTA